MLEREEKPLQRSRRRFSAAQSSASAAAAAGQSWGERGREDPSAGAAGIAGKITSQEVSEHTWKLHPEL